MFTMVVNRSECRPCRWSPGATAPLCTPSSRHCIHLSSLCQFSAKNCDHI